MRRTNRFTPSILAVAIGLTSLSFAQDPATPPVAPETERPGAAAPTDLPPLNGRPAGERPADAEGPRGERRDGDRRGGPGGPGGFPMGMRGEKKLLVEFDKNLNGRLELEERKPAREKIEKERKENPGRQRGPGGRGGFGGPPPGGPEGGAPGNPGGPQGPEGGRPEGPGGPSGFGGPGRPGGFGRRENLPPPEPGPKLTPAEVQSYRGVPFYDEATLRTLFVDFEVEDWEKELEDFHNTDVEVPVKLTVDGQTFEDVGVHFRGASSYMMIPAGRKRSLNLSVDEFHPEQKVGGYRTLNLLNSNGDATYLRAVLYHHIARNYIPSPKANFVRVVLNGESWGVYLNVQQFNKDFIAEWFGTSKGARWKAPGSPRGNSGLEYLGDDVAEYKKRFEIKSKDNLNDWAALINLCKVLNQTPAEQLEEALKPILDIDGALKFLALENVMINTDGYWTRASDYNLYKDTGGRFHIIPHDVNETFRTPGGPGMRGNEGGGNAVGLDPLAGAEDANKPLLSKLLAVPALKTRYLGYVKTITEDWMEWNKLAPLVTQYQALIADDVKASTRNLESFEAFTKGAAEDVEEEGSRGPRRSLSLKSFVEQRRAFLLNHPAVKETPVIATTH